MSNLVMLTAPTFRTATQADAEAVAHVYLASRKQLVSFAPLAHSDEDIHRWIRESLIPTGQVTVAQQEGKIIGMMALSTDETANWLDHLYVHPHSVGRGIGTKLVERAKAVLGSPIRLYTFQANLRAMWNVHVWLVRGYSGLSLILLLWVYLSPFPQRVRSLTTSMPVLLGLQFLTIHLKTPIPLAVLHPLIGFTLFSVSTTLVHRSRGVVFPKPDAEDDAS